jgi:hypothetical protein
LEEIKLEKEYSDYSLDELEEIYKKSLIKGIKQNDEKDKAFKEANPPVSKINTVTPGPIVGGNDGEGNYDFDGWYEKLTMMEYTDSDTGCETDVSSWSPADNYAGRVWQAVISKANLFDICVKGIDIKAGDGLSVQIKTMGKFAAPTAQAACECKSCVSSSLNTHTLTLLQYAQVTEICAFDEFDVGGDYRSAVIKAFGNSYAELFNSLIWTEVSTAAAGTSIDLAATLACTPSIAGSCCTDASLLNFYNAVNECTYTMQGNDYEPDYMVLSPSVAAILKRMQTPTVQPWADQVVKIGADGKLKSFNGLKVIEYSGATACSTATDTVFAVIVDSSRACGAAFGKRPRMEFDRNIECNSTTAAMWAFFAAGELEVGAIGHIKSPDA